ncbi:nucleotide exchange factor GrpE [Candidatus Roizmanbacteria bacterium]|nr:nucleotide exchange factor GrpE [Candidatus Roizmanbacteria bacterium]
MKNDDKKKEIPEEKLEEIEETEVSDELQQKVEEFETKYKRALADYQNLQKRVQEEKSEWIKTSSMNLILRLLPALDHLETALKGAKEKGEQSGWLKGVEMTVLELRRVLEEEGLRSVQVEKFDPTVHEVVEAREGPENVIVDLFQMGYTLNGKLIRPAKVAVGRGK